MIDLLAVMEFRAILYNIFLSFLIFYFSFTIYDAIALPDDIFYTLLFMVLMSLVILIHKNLLVFLTVSRVFLTIFLTVSILVGVALYILDYTLPGLYVNNIVISGQSFQFLTTEQIELSKLGTILIVSVTTGLIYSIIHSLRGSSKS